jgi:hypothetical protein
VFSAKNQNLLLVVLIVVLMAELATLVWLKPPAGAALAQTGDAGGQKRGNAVVRQEASISPVEFAPVAAQGDLGPQSDGSGVEVMSNGAFRNDGDSVDGWRNLFSGGFIHNNSPDPACFMAPVYPPNGATLTEFRFSILDKSAAKNLLFVRLHRVRLATGTVDVVSGGALTQVLNNPNALELFFQNPKIVPGTERVSNAYAYYVDLCFDGGTGTDILFYGARLFYTP